MRRPRGVHGRLQRGRDVPRPVRRDLRPRQRCRDAGVRGVPREPVRDRVRHLVRRARGDVSAGEPVRGCGRMPGVHRDQRMPGRDRLRDGPRVPGRAPLPVLERHARRPASLSATSRAGRGRGRDRREPLLAEPPDCHLVLVRVLVGRRLVVRGEGQLAARGPRYRRGDRGRLRRALAGPSRRRAPEAVQQPGFSCAKTR